MQGSSLPHIILGTWAIGGWMWGGTDEKESIEAIRTSIECGIRAIDTAPAYGNGLSEQIVGKAIQGYDRDHLLIATKCGLIWNHKDPYIRKNLKAASILNECDQSLKRLKVDYIDLYQIHWNDPHTPIEESWGAMVKLLEVGKVRAIGVCNFSAAELATAHALFPIHTLQSPYSLMRRGIEVDILPFCQNNQIALLAYSPLERGLLTGKIGLKTRFSAADHREQSPTFSMHNRKLALEALNKLKAIVEKHKATPAQLILQCTYRMPGITAVLVGARTGAQAAENIGALSLRLTEGERLAIVNAFASEDMQLSD
jgi:aryl-alcohol dehydrogenase-like predicted oxidoreductase